jgi:hypothetical protein
MDGHRKVQINNLLIDFGRVSGKQAHDWLKIYIRAVLELMESEGKVPLSQIEKDYDEEKKRRLGNGKSIQS